jgi:hypothetical protein
VGKFLFRGKVREKVRRHVHLRGKENIIPSKGESSELSQPTKALWEELEGLKRD